MTSSRDTPLKVSGVAYGLALACFAAYQQFKLPVVLPVLLAEYDYDRTLAGGFMSIYAVAGLALSIPFGRAIDRHGPFVLIAIALVVGTAGAGLALGAPQWGSLVLAGRALEGVAFAVLAVAGPVIAQASSSRRYLPIVIAVTATWIPVGQISASLLTPLALATWGWRLLWWIAIAASVALLVWTIGIWMRARGEPAARHASTGPPVALDREQRRALWLVGSIFLLWSSQYFAFVTWLPQYVVETFGVDVATAQWSYVLPVAFVLLFNLVTGVLLRLGWSLGALMVGSIALQTAIWWSLPLVEGAAAGLAALVAYGIGAGITPACMFAMPSAILGAGRNTTRAFAVIMTGRNVGVLIGPVLLAQAFEWTDSWELASPVFGVPITLCLLLATALARKIGASPATRNR